MKTYKRIKYILKRILPLLLLVAALNACSDKLDQNPTNAYASETFWTNETNARIALTGVYRGNINYSTHVNPTDWWAYCGLIFFEHATDNAFDRRGKNAEQNRLTNGTLVATNGTIASLWTGSYARNTMCNYFLENIGQVNMDEDEKKRMIAEVRFIRACQYFYLSQFWGDVPLVTKTLTPDEANSVAKTAKSDIINFILTEFSEAVEDLPRYKDIPADEFGRASKQAALAFLGRVYLSEKRYSEAAAVYKEIIDYGDNIIDPDYATIFTDENETSAENIFSVQFLANTAPNALPLHAYPAVKGGYNIVNPMESLAIQYDFTDGTPFSYDDPRFDSHNMAANRDPRFAATFLWNGCEFAGSTYVCHPDSSSSVDQLTYSKQATRTGYGLRKFFNESFSGDPKTGYGGNLPIIRYAEVLLSYLEAELEAGKPITQDLLNGTINKIRGRKSVNMPAITEADPELLRPILRKERRIELALEGIRYWDLLRWGILGETMQGDFWGASFPDAKKTGSKTDPTGHKRWWVDNKAFRIGQDEVWPIPQTEQDINPNLSD